MSEFGRGFTTCLLMFTFHARRLEEVLPLSLPGYLESKRVSMHVEMWANAASDHLYDLVIGPRVAKADRAVAEHMARDALTCGHGFTERMWTREEARQWLTIAMALLAKYGDPKTIEEAMEIDRGLGLKPDKGEYGCSEYLPEWEKK